MTTRTSLPPSRTADTLRRLAERLHKLTEAERLTLALVAEDALARTVADDRDDG